MRIIVMAVAVAVAGCAPQANFRHPRPDELRPGDIAPPPGPFVESVVPPGVQPASGPFVPLPAGEALRAEQPQPYQLPVYQMPVQQQQYQKPIFCNTNRVGGTVYTNCH